MTAGAAKPQDDNGSLSICADARERVPPEASPHPCILEGHTLHPAKRDCMTSGAAESSLSVGGTTDHRFGRGSAIAISASGLSVAPFLKTLGPTRTLEGKRPYPRHLAPVPIFYLPYPTIVPPSGISHAQRAPPHLLYPISRVRSTPLFSVAEPLNRAIVASLWVTLICSAA